MRYPLRLRLSLSTLVVLLTGMSLATGLTWAAVERLYLNTQKDNLVAQAEITAAAIEDSSLPVEPVEPYMQMLNVAPGIHTRLLSESGAVVVGLPTGSSDTPVQVPAAENIGYVPSEELLQRPEIQSALEGDAASAVRKVLSANGQRVLYAAAPIFDESRSVSGIVYLATPLPQTGLPTEVMAQFTGIVILAVVLAGLAGTFLARGIAQPVEDLDQAAVAVSKGDLNRIVPADHNIPELERLSQSFNEMTASLKQSNQVKNAFIADVTHELRTPLTVIKGTIETLEDGALDDMEGRLPLLASMGRETDRLIRLVNDLLVLTRADASALRLRIEPVNLASLARTRCRQIKPLADEGQIQLEVVAPSSQGDLMVLGDSDRLAQIFDNLLDNAIRHAPTNSNVNIRIRRDGEAILCQVRDYGAGIPAEHLPYIFERFYRVDPSRNRQTGGTGLGLAIVLALAKAHNGRIRVESPIEGGAEFSFWLPAARTAP